MGKPDKHDGGRSDEVPFVPGESAKERHQRRFEFAVDNRGEMRKFCMEHEIEFKMANNREHWIFIKGTQVVEWWPRTAKLVINKKWEDGIHTHSPGMVKHILIDTFKLVRVSPVEKFKKKESELERKLKAIRVLTPLIIGGIILLVLLQTVIIILYLTG
jgi:hypothetical protein